MRTDDSDPSSGPHIWARVHKECKTSKKESRGVLGKKRKLGVSKGKNSGLWKESRGLLEQSDFRGVRLLSLEMFAEVE